MKDGLLMSVRLDGLVWGIEISNIPGNMRLQQAVFLTTQIQQGVVDRRLSP